MARKKISEYKAKSLIINNYNGFQITLGQSLSEFDHSRKYVVKVDQGEKKRYKRGLLHTDVSVEQILEKIIDLENKGFSQFLIEPMQNYSSNEMYISLELVRSGIRIIFSEQGGVDIEENNSSQVEILPYEISENETQIRSFLNERFHNSLISQFIQQLIIDFKNIKAGFLEINPFVIQDDKVIPLDAAVLVDDAAEFLVNGLWTSEDFIQSKNLTEYEKQIQKLDESTPASLKLSVLNENGGLFFLLSSGGASIILADEAFNSGLQNEIVNYGEYSGSPTREETYLYTKQILEMMMNSASEVKHLVIAGGVANFTDVYKTFSGIIDALSEKVSDLQNMGVKVFVRRGGPNEEKGLSAMEKFLKKNDLFGSVDGSDSLLTQPILNVRDKFSNM